MTPLRVRFTGLDLDPADLIDRVHHGVIPPEWHRYRCQINVPVWQINRWLTTHIEGRWAILTGHVNDKREVTIAFERDYDGVMFVLSDGQHQCANDETLP